MSAYPDKSEILKRWPNILQFSWVIKNGNKKIILRIYLLVSWNLAKSGPRRYAVMALSSSPRRFLDSVHHVFFFFYIFDCVSRRTRPNLLMASDAIDVTRAAWWPFRWSKQKRGKKKQKTSLGPPRCARAAANLPWPHCAAVCIEKKMRRSEKKGCCYILSSGQHPCWEPSREGMYSIDP